VIPICTVFTINSTLISFYWFGTFPTRIFYWTRISWNDNLFSVDGYKVQRRDRNQYGGGLLTFIRPDFPSSRKQSLESETIETPCHEVYIVPKGVDVQVCCHELFGIRSLDISKVFKRVFVYIYTGSNSGCVWFILYIFNIKKGVAKNMQNTVCTEYGGGLLTLIRPDFPSSRKNL
jgi:hypothetical protein